MVFIIGGIRTGERMRRHITRLGAAAVTALAMLVAAISPAMAAALPSGQHITVVGSGSAGDAGDAVQFYDVAEANAVGTPIGSPLARPPIVAIDVDASGHGYAIGRGSSTELQLQLLFHADANAGTVSDPLPIRFPLDVGECYDLDILFDGRLVATCEGLDAENVATAWFAFIDTDSGIITPIHAVALGPDGPHYRGVASDPATGAIWVYWQQGDDAFGAIFGLDGSVGPSVQVDVLPLAADFATVGPYQGPVLIAILAFVRREFGFGDPATGTFTRVAAFDFDVDEDDDVTALTVWGSAPALAATGRAGVQSLLGGAVSAILVLAGAVTLTVERRRRQRSAT